MHTAPHHSIIVDITQQTLSLYAHGRRQIQYPVSTAKNGTGQLENSFCTPLGGHVISHKIGHDMVKGTVFVGREPTDELYDALQTQAFPERDWMLSRILWLSGVELGFNQGVTADGQCCDSHQRYIYIHGTPDSEPMGVPASHGCIRMRSDDVMALFDQVVCGTPVTIIQSV